MAEPAHVVADSPGILDDLRHGAEDIVRRGPGNGGRDAGLRRQPERLVDTVRVVGNRADGIVPVEIAEVAVEGRAGIDEQDVARLEDAVMRPADDLGHAAGTRDRRHEGRRVGAAAGDVDPELADGFAFGFADRDLRRERLVGVAGDLADEVDVLDLGRGLDEADVPEAGRPVLDRAGSPCPAGAGTP